jgi:hypothetical protein
VKFYFKGWSLHLIIWKNPLSNPGQKPAIGNIPAQSKNHKKIITKNL